MVESDEEGGDYEEIIEKLEGVLTEKELEINKYLKKIGQDKKKIEILMEQSGKKEWCDYKDLEAGDSWFLST